MSLTGKTKAGTYKDILQMNNSNGGVDASLRNVVDGEGTASSILISDDNLKVIPQNNDTTSTFRVTDKNNNNLLVVDSSNDLVKAGIGQHIVNTQIKKFAISKAELASDTADQWQAIPSTYGDLSFDVELGSGTTPNTSHTIGTSASGSVQHQWWLPLNITIASAHVWFGATAATGDDLEFVIMQYDINTLNGAQGGDWSNGVVVCSSPSVIVGAGYEQAYYQSLTIDTADVDAGKILVAFFRQDGTSSDHTVEIQLVYNLR